MSTKKKALDLGRNALAVIGAISIVVGAIVGIQALKDRWTSPDLEVLGLAIVSVFDRAEGGTGGRERSDTMQGIFCIAHVRSGPRASVVTGLDIGGKVNLSFNEYLGYLDYPEGTPLEKVESDFVRRKPYRLIAWTGVPVEEESQARLEAHEELFIRFNVLGLAHGGGSWPRPVPLADFVGFDDNTMKPKKVDELPQSSFLFVGASGPNLALGLRDEVRDGMIRIHVRAGERSVLVPPSNIRFRRVSRNQWERLDAQVIYLRTDHTY